MTLKLSDKHERQFRQICAELDIPVEDDPISGVDVFVPLLERIRAEGGVVLLKWDGPRERQQYTAMLGGQRADGPTIETAIVRALVNYAKEQWDVFGPLA